MIDITIDQFNMYLFNAGILGCVIGVLLLGGLAIFIIFSRRQYLKHYLHEIPTEKRDDLIKEISMLENSLKKLAEETNTTYFKSDYNEIQKLILYLKTKFI